ncbi:Uncharacterised protein [Bordetella pertussis]|nr:Uncharacterised protein [Bordetella pertussis]
MTGTPSRRSGSRRARGVQSVGQVYLVEHDHRLDVGAPGAGQGAAGQVVREGGFDRHDDQQLVDVGGELLDAHFVGAKQQVAPRQHGFDGAFVAALRGDAHAVADGRAVLLAARKALPQRAVGQLHGVVATVGGDDQAFGLVAAHAPAIRWRMRTAAGGWLS